jgi:hypothetical protein
VIARLSDREARLVVTERGASSGAPTAIEVAHEALIRGWKELRLWIEDNRASMRTRDRLAEAAKEWAAAAPDKKDDYLFTGARLAEAVEWASTHLDDPGDLESAFLATSKEARQEEADRERRRREEAEAQARKERSLRQRFVAVAIVAGLFALVSGGLGWLAQNYADKVKNALIDANLQRTAAETEAKRARAQERIAESRRLAVLSDSVLPLRLDQAMLLAVEATSEDTLEARGCLQRCLDTRPEISQFSETIFGGRVTSVAFGPGGVIAAGYVRAGGGVVLLDAKGQRLRPVPVYE